MIGSVLITGASGFVGSHLVAELGDDALPTDVDVTDPEDVAAAVRTTSPRAVVHLAACASVADSWKDPPGAWRVNALGTVNVLAAVRAEAPAARVILASSGEVYGRADTIPTPENAPTAPLSPYAASKVAAEVACAQMVRSDGLDVVVVRAFPLIGPGQGGNFAIGSWVRQIATLESRGGGVLRVGDLEVKRDLTDVRDACAALRLLLNPDVPASTYNMASGTAVALEDVVESLRRLATRPIEVERDPARLRPSDIRILAGDSSKLHRATGWQPTISLETSLADALDEVRTIGRTGMNTPS